jgi:hypothetical protein
MLWSAVKVGKKTLVGAVRGYAISKNAKGFSVHPWKYVCDDRTRVAVGGGFLRSIGVILTYTPVSDFRTVSCASWPGRNRVVAQDSSGVVKTLYL